MVQVYLPMGYPIQTGNEFENVIFQGNLVRLYTVPKDPRNDSQIFQRRFFSDIMKMRSTLGEFGKEACKTVFGSKWATIIYQMVKADIQSWYSDAVDEWDGFADISKDAWREESPYIVTFNDMGKVFFCLSRVMGKALEHYSEYAFEGEEWGAGDSALAKAWWDKEIFVVNESKYNFGTGAINEIGSGWSTVTNANALNGSYRKCDTAGDNSMNFYVYGLYLSFKHLKHSAGGESQIYANGVLLETLNQYHATSLWQQTYTRGLGSKGLHFIEVVPGANGFNYDGFVW